MCRAPCSCRRPGSGVLNATATVSDIVHNVRLASGMHVMCPELLVPSSISTSPYTIPTMSTPIPTMSTPIPIPIENDEDEHQHFNSANLHTAICTLQSAHCNLHWYAMRPLLCSLYMPCALCYAAFTCHAPSAMQPLHAEHQLAHLLERPLDCTPCSKNSGTRADHEQCKEKDEN
jgi:hypothetical protein